jgi:excisionase family DNA binding protein
MTQPKFECSGVYFVLWQGHIKIGSAEHVEQRRRSLESGYPFGDVVPLGWIPVPYTDHVDPSRHERKIHRALGAYRGRGEWFHDRPPVRRFIGRYAKPWPVEVRVEEFVSSKVAAEQLGINRQTLRKYIRAGLLKAQRLPSGYWRIPRSAIEQLLTDGKPHETAIELRGL